MNNQNTSISHNERFDKTKRLVTLAMLMALTLVLGLIPNIGFIQLPPPIPAFTIVHVPVIIGAIVLGPAEGAFLGLIFGITSIVEATIVSSATSFLFSPFVPYGNWKSAVIAIVPRVLIGLIAGWVYQLISRNNKRVVITASIAGIAGSFTNTLFVLLGMYLLFQNQYTSLVHLKASEVWAVLAALGTVIVTNGIAEAVVAAIAVPAVSKALFAAMRRR